MSYRFIKLRDDTKGFGRVAPVSLYPAAPDANMPRLPTYVTYAACSTRSDRMHTPPATLNPKTYTLNLRNHMLAVAEAHRPQERLGDCLAGSKQRGICLRSPDYRMVWFQNGKRTITNLHHGISGCKLWQLPTSASRNLGAASSEAFAADRGFAILKPYSTCSIAMFSTSYK